MCSKVFVLCFVVVCFVSIGLCLGEYEGDACWIGSLNTTGICKTISECAYARNLLLEDMITPPMCRWTETTRIVCCPVDKTPDGIKSSKNTICVYDGSQPIICCPKKQAALPPETGCPPLDIPRPTTSPVHIGWRKCLEYQRYVHKCIASNQDPDVMHRENRCGIPRHNYRLVKRFSENEFPHMALLGREDPSREAGMEWTGEGALVSDRYVLTAAHVLIDPEDHPVQNVLLGTINNTDLNRGLLFNIARKIPHPLFHMSVRKHDIAIVELDRRVLLSEFIRPACLPISERKLEDPSRMIIAGWRGSANDENSSNILLSDSVIILDGLSECNKFFSRSFSYDSTSMMCAAGYITPASVGDTCHGYSGTPLISLMLNLDCTYSVEGIGITPRCGRRSIGMYTRVSHYLDWIVQNVWPDDYDEASLAAI